MFSPSHKDENLFKLDYKQGHALMDLRREEWLQEGERGTALGGTDLSP